MRYIIITIILFSLFSCSSKVVIQSSSDFNYPIDAKRGTIRYSNGNEYIGELKDSKSYGEGITKYRNGDIYKGMHKNDKKHGKGIFKFANKDIYIGEWKNDVIVKKGTFLTYEGNLTRIDYSKDKS